MLLPTTLLTANASDPRNTELTLTNNSGALVPRETMVRPITNWGIPKIRAKAASETSGFYEQERKLDAIDKAIEKDSQASSGLVGSILAGASKMAGSGSNSSEGSISNEDLKYKLFNLKDMLNSGLISKEEYEQKKKELLSKY